MTLGLPRSVLASAVGAGLIIAATVATHVADITVLRVINLSVFIVIVSWNPNEPLMHSSDRLCAARHLVSARPPSMPRRPGGSHMGTHPASPPSLPATC